MNKAYYYRMIILLLSVLFTLHTQAQEKATRNIQESFPLPSDGIFTIDNKYGNVEIEGWEKDLVIVEIQISVKHKYLSKAEDLLDRIKPTFVSREDHIHVTSVVRERKKNLFNDFFKDLIPLDINKTDVDIDYKIKLPRNVRLEITNLFGDVVIDNCNGELMTDLGHGSLWLNSLVKSAEINLKFGRLEVRELPDTRLNLKNSKVYIRTAGKIESESSSSEVEIGNVDLLLVNGSRDEYDIEKVKTIRGDLRYTTLRIEELTQSMDLSTYLGGVRFDLIPLKDCDIKLSEKSSDIDINVGKAAFDLDVTLEDGTLRLPESAENVQKEFIDELNNHRHIRASFGKENKGKILMIGKKGSVILRDF